jgi:hypothetical protein
LIVPTRVIDSVAMATMMLRPLTSGADWGGFLITQSGVAFARLLCDPLLDKLY